MTIRKKYSKEFKLDAVSLVVDQGYSRAEAARSLDITANLLGRWVKENDSKDGQAFRGNGKLTPEQEENRRLKAQVKWLEMEKEILKKNDGILCSLNVKKYSFITQQKKTYSISLQCQVLCVNRSGCYHDQANGANKPVDSVHQELVEWVKNIAEDSHYSYGSRRMMKALTLRGYPVNRDKARKLMREAGVQVRHRKKSRSRRTASTNTRCSIIWYNANLLCHNPTRSTPRM